MKILIEFSRAHPWHSLAMLACMVVASVTELAALSMLLPLVSLLLGSEDVGGGEASAAERFIVDGIRQLGYEPSRGLLLAGIPAAFIVRAGILLVARREIGNTIAHVITAMRLRLIRALFRTRWSYFVGQRIGTFSNAYAVETTRSSIAYLNATWVVMLGLQLVVYLTLAAAVSWRLTLGLIAVGAIAITVLGPLISVSRRAGLKQTKIFTSAMGTLADALQAVKPLKAMAREDRLEPLLTHDTRRMEKAMRKQVLSRETMSALQEPTVVCVLCGGVSLLWALGFEISSIAVLGLVVERIFGALNRGQRRYQNVSVQESAYWSLLRTIEEAEAAAEDLRGGEPPVLEKAIELRAVGFRYDDRWLFERLDLRIPAGSFTALVGPSGAGKTTVADLVVGLVTPERGEVCLDGVPLASIDLDRWRRGIGYVPQEMFLLHDTIANNVSLGDPEVGREEIERALREAHAWDFVSALPQGLDTVVGERGSALSGGQRQRVAIARAMLHHPWLLVLDEATAALDPSSEAAVWEAVCELRGSTTVLAISHQDAVLDVADTVYRISGGNATLLRGTESAESAESTQSDSELEDRV